jgi:nitrogen fixation protein NifB
MVLPMLNPTTPIQQSDCTPQSCGSGAEQMNYLPEAIRQKIFDHPCYSEQAHHFFARMHVAVAPACNIQCHYCNRKYNCANESRPGVVSELLTPEQAVKKVLAVATAIPEMTIVGVAGPGDPLANPQRTFSTLQQVAEQAPDLKFCLSTNGLALPQYVDEIIRHNIGHVTITINCVDPAIGAHIYPWIFWQHKRIRGAAAAAILIEQQQRGLEMLVERGILVKVNSVLIPGINDEHLKVVAKVVKAKGAFLHNIIPLIAQPEHGTYYGLTGQREPTSEELTTLQAACAVNMTMMRHCRQCRADAVGRIGEDRGAEFSLDQLETTTVDYAAAMIRRQAFQQAVAKQLTHHQVSHAAKLQFIPIRQKPLTGSPPPRPIRIAVASKGNGLVNEHFGHAKEFLIYEASPQGVHFIGHRKTELYCMGSDTCGDSEVVLENIIQLLADCEVVLCARIGFEPWRALESAGLLPNNEHALEPIEAAIMAVYQERLKATPLVQFTTGCKIA